MPTSIESKIQTQTILKNHCSWRVGGPAEFFVLPESLVELQEAQAWAQQRQIPITWLGGGSNVLISDQGIVGLVICLKQFSGMEPVQRVQDQGEEYLEFTALAGTGKSELLKTFLREKNSAALFLAGIPGDVGGGVVMNAGVGELINPREFTEIVHSIEVLKPSGQLQTYLHDQILWSYRHSAGWGPGVITRAKFRVRAEIDALILEKVREANRVRLSKQPLDLPSCGSVFVNPPGLRAAQLVDSCGLKGYAVGGAQVSTKHANFIVNTGAATASEIWQVIVHVQAEVKRIKQVELKTEVIQLGAVF